jgi:hypothetical protein
MFVPQRKHTYVTPRPVTETALFFYMSTMFVPDKKHAYGPPRPVTRVALLYFNKDCLPIVMFVSKNLQTRHSLNRQLHREIWYHYDTKDVLLCIDSLDFARFGYFSSQQKSLLLLGWFTFCFSRFWLFILVKPVCVHVSSSSAPMNSNIRSGKEVWSFQADIKFRNRHDSLPDTLYFTLLSC